MPPVAPSPSPAAQPPFIPQHKLNVLIVDDEPAFCRLARVLIDSCPHLYCVGEAHSAPAALAKARVENPDVILMDVVMRGGNGIECTKAFTALMPKIAVVVMTGIHRPQGVMEALMAGAKGYLLKPFTRQECQEALLHAHRGGIHISPSATALFSTCLQNFRAPNRDHTPLSQREEEILAGFFQGLTDKEIAEALNISPATVHTHAFNLFKKLQVSSRQEAIQKYTSGLFGESEPEPKAEN